MWIFCFVFMSIIGLFFGAMFTVNIENRLTHIITTIIIACFVGGIMTGAFYIETSRDDFNWNDGVCPNCTKEWRLVNVEHIHNNGDRYHFICDNCGKLITTNHYMKG